MGVRWNEVLGMIAINMLIKNYLPTNRRTVEYPNRFRTTLRGWSPHQIQQRTHRCGRTRVARSLARVPPKGEIPIGCHSRIFECFIWDCQLVIPIEVIHEKTNQVPCRRQSCRRLDFISSVDGRRFPELTGGRGRSVPPAIQPRYLQYGKTKSQFPTISPLA